MAKQEKIATTDPSTEEKIKQAARKVFTQKGFAATRTRDIAEEAGINLALLNYYFRSKEKLFDMVMLENLQQFLMAMGSVLHNQNTDLEAKVTIVAANYIDMLKANPDLPLFILSEIRANPEKLASNMRIRELLLNSEFFKQLRETNENINPLHLLINILGMTVFPFVASPLLKIIGDLKQDEFMKMMEERKKLIPVWVMAMLKQKG
jgi:AcrR family transcriptional regulator